MVASNVSFEYSLKPINDLRVMTSKNNLGKTVVDSVDVDGEPMEATDRFWTSLFARFGFNSAFFKYFDHAETFARIAEKERGNVRLCIERSGDQPRLLAVSNPGKPVVGYDDLMGILENYNGQNIQYTNGIVQSTHTPRVSNNFQILGDAFENRFVMQAPVDGYGSPNLYLSLMRHVCTNGVVAMSRAFRSSLALGRGDENVGPTLIRALDGFNNDEGYAAIRQRIEAAGTSWMSVFESQQLYKLLVRMHHHGWIDINPKADGKIGELAGSKQGGNGGGIGSPIITSFHRLTGDPAESYGLANLDALSSKRQRTLPVSCTVYDAINFTTEVATHHATPEGSRRLNGFIGGMISSEYDMEGTKDRFGEFADFLVDAKMGAGLTGSEHALASMN